jgi:hypothetical protein
MIDRFVEIGFAKEKPDALEGDSGSIEWTGSGEAFVQRLKMYSNIPSLRAWERAEHGLAFVQLIAGISLN